MDTITLNGEEYVRASEVANYGNADYSHVCVIATNGWIFEGRRDAEQGCRGYTAGPGPPLQYRAGGRSPARVL